MESANKLRFLNNVPPDKYFILNNGFIIKSLPELLDAVRAVDDETFSHHVTSERNDFANWIGYVIGDNELRNSILGINSRDQFARILDKRIGDIHTNEYEAIHPELFGFLDSDVQELRFDAPVDGEMLGFEVGDEPLVNDDGSIDSMPLVMQEAVDATAQPVETQTETSVPADQAPATAQPTTAPAGQAPVDSQPAAGAQGEQQPASQAPADQTPTATQPAAEVPVEQAPAGQQPVEMQPVAGAQVEQQPAEAQAAPEQASAEQAPVEAQPHEQPSEQTSAEQSPTDQAPIDTQPAAGAQAGQATGDQAPVDSQPASDQAAGEETGTAAGAEGQGTGAVFENKDSVGIDTGQQQPADSKPTSVSGDDSTTIEIRELEAIPIGLPEIDALFKSGLPKICNILFVGVMSSGKTRSGLRLILNTAKRGGKSVYMSAHDSEEKIINILKDIDPDILNYINSGNIIIKRINPFEIASLCKKKSEGEEVDLTEYLGFMEEYHPNIVVFDSLSSLEMSFPNDKLSYRYIVDHLFKYFEKLGILAVFIKELKRKEDLHKEFFENILADIIISFSPAMMGRLNLSVIKSYPVQFSQPQVPGQPKQSPGKGIFSFLKRKKPANPADNLK